MSSASSRPTNVTAKAERASSVGRNSLIMASGTLASRLTGLVRNAMLVWSLGSLGIAADAFQIGSTLPNTILNLLAGGVVNAILVPQVVRALKEKDGQHRLNKILTLSILVFLAFALVSLALTPILVAFNVNPNWTPAQRSLVTAFTVWSMPQIFFYGVYTVVGQVLAARDRFGVYAWSSVATNIISSLGFGIFIALFGTFRDHPNRPLDFWTTTPILLSAGFWTIGVAVQAVLCLVSLLRLGMRLRPELGLHGLGLRSMSKVTSWTLAGVALDFLLGFYVNQVASGAPVAGRDVRNIAGNQAYAQAFQIYVLPYALITVSIATAVFPRIAHAVAEKRIEDVRASLSNSIRTSSAVVTFFTAVFIAIPVPIIRTLLPSVSIDDATQMALPLIAFSLALVPVSIGLLIRRTFFAFEDGRSSFFYALMTDATQAVLMLVGTLVLRPAGWVTAIAASLSLSSIICIPVFFAMVRRRMGGRADGRAIASSLVRVLIGGTVTLLVGLLFSQWAIRLAGAEIARQHGTHMSWFQAIVVCVVVGVFMLAVYTLLLSALRVKELNGFLGSLIGRLTSRLTGRLKPGPTGPDAKGAQAAAGATAAEAGPPAGDNQVQAAGTGRVASSAPVPSVSTPARMGDGTNSGNNRGKGVMPNMSPAVGDTVNGRYTLISSYRSEPGMSAWLANDEALAQDCQLFIVSDSSKLPKVNALASSLALSRDPRFTRVRHFQKFGEVSVIVTDNDEGASLDAVLAVARRRRAKADQADRSAVNASQDTAEDAAAKVASPRPLLDIEATRTILGEVALAANDLRKVSLNHQAISTHTIRLSAEQISLADAPVSPLLTTPIKPRTHDTSDEVLAVRQIAAVLFEIVTGTVFEQNISPTQMQSLFEPYRDSVPPEFASICSRALDFVQPDGSPTVPILTLAELLVLLGSWSTPADLGADALTLPPTRQTTASIRTVTFAPVDPRNVRPIPAEVSAKRPERPRPDGGEPINWRAPQLLFAGGDAVEEMTPASTNFLSAFDSSSSSSLADLASNGDEAGLSTDSLGSITDVSHATQALAIPASPSQRLADQGPAGERLGSEGLTNEIARPQQTLPRTGQTALGAPDAAQAAEGTDGAGPAEESILGLPDLARQADDQDLPGFEESGTAIPAFPPSFKPGEGGTAIGLIPAVGSSVGEAGIDATRPARPAAGSGTADVSRGEDEGKSLLGRNVGVVAAAVVLVIALIWAIVHLGISPTTIHPSDPSTNQNSWNIDPENTPYPNGQPQSGQGTADQTKDKQAPATPVLETKDKDAKAVPAPSSQPVTNTVPFPIANTSIIRNVPGHSGIGLYIRLAKAEPVQRLQITTHTGGGTVQLYALPAGADLTDPANSLDASPLTQFSFKDGGQMTQVDLPHPITTQDLVVWVSQLPGGFYYSSVRVY